MEPETKDIGWLAKQFRTVINIVLDWLLKMWTTFVEWFYALLSWIGDQIQSLLDALGLDWNQLNPASYIMDAVRELPYIATADTIIPGFAEGIAIGITTLTVLVTILAIRWTASLIPGSNQ
jgi:hypothetical protein